RDPVVPSGVEALILETTYGDRLHSPIERMEDELAEIVTRVHARGGKLIIPSFALERAQEVVYALKRLHRRGRLPELPVFVDSPLTLRITDAFRMHPECFDEELQQILLDGDSPFDFPGLSYVSSVEESKAIDATRGPAIIIAASGMCEFGRVVHHLKAFIGDRRSAVLIVGFQAQHTLGRRLVEQRRQVRILGVERERLAEVVVLNGFSAHADQADLLAFAEAVRDRGKLRHLILVHGEPAAQQTMAALLADRDFPRVEVPSRGDRIRI
ncbi:MAG: MBL fold metallo-hydrolase, partial [Myxococcales bacterium]|nr:MBL fold metallo-hydrolase [Myxococcales bacterium]